MKQRCIYCGKSIEEVTCPHCHESNDVSKMPLKEIHRLHQNAHNKITQNSDLKNSGLVLIVTGLILLIVGGLFLFTSFKFNVVHVREFRPASVEFIISAIALSVSLFNLVFGTSKLIRALRNLRFYNEVITSTEKPDLNRALTTGLRIQD